MSRAHRSTVLVDRPLVRSTDHWFGRPPVDLAREYRKENLVKTAQEMGIYTLSKIIAVAIWDAQIAPPVNRPVDRSTVTFLTVEPTVNRPVDRPPPESGVLSVGRPRGRPAEWLAFVHVPRTSVDRAGRSTTGSVDRSVRPPVDLAEIFRD